MGMRFSGKTIYIMEDTYEMSDFTARTFFKVFDKKETGRGNAGKED